MGKTGKTASTPFAEPSAAEVRSLGRALLAWYERERRELPWRRTRDPYAIWVSEVMLQQTRVKTVLPYYARWLERFPTIEALAQSDDDAVLASWQGLGYYSRARALLRGARAVVEQHGGRMPSDVAELRALPGIGPYTAGAIASIAFERPEPIVDGNVIRVLSRRFALRGDPRKAPLARFLWELAARLLPARRPGDFNQALMELGATVCTPRAPRCEACPLARGCAAQKSGQVEAFPELAARPVPTSVQMVACVIERRGRVLLEKLPPDAPRWAGMWQFPSAEVGKDESAESALVRLAHERAGLTITSRERLLVVRHGVTRYRITLEAYRCQARGRPLAAARWHEATELAELALPSAQRRIARHWLSTK